MNKPAAVRPFRQRRLPGRKALLHGLTALFRLVFIVGICFMILYPLLTRVSMSFMDETDLYDRTVKAIPKHFTPGNYVDAVLYTNYFSVLGNTVLLCGVTALLQTLSCTVVGYGFARFRVRGQGLLFGLVIVCMVVPTQVILTPLYLNFKAMHMIGGFAPFIALALTGVAPRCGLYIFLARQYFRGIPREIDEAAAIDGAGPYRTFTAIMLKSALPIMMTVFLFSFVWQWGENSYTTLFYSDFQTLAKTLGSLGYDINPDVHQAGTSFVSIADQMAYQSIMFATTTILAVLPLLLIYVACQRFFIQSVEQTGIVG